MFRWLPAVAGIVYALSILGAMAAGPAASAPGGSAGANATAPVTSAASGALAKLPHPVVGFAINFHHTEQLDDHLKAIDEMAAMGFNTVEILTPAFQRDGAATDIKVDVSPGQSPRREDLIKLLKHARDKGLTTKLMPLVLFSNPRGNEWRGKIQPEQWDPWWQAYRKNIDHFVDIANEAHVTIFSVGSELLTTEKQTDRWNALIDHVRKRFPGLLSYSTNWDHYHVPTFWKRLDMIGINGYWDLTTLAKSDPPEAQALAQRWREIRTQVLDFAATQDKPVLMTEIGYPTLPWALKDPWNYVNTNNSTPDPKAQLAGFKAFFSAWSDLLAKPDPSRFVGVCFFEWDVYHSGGEDDTGYGVRGKPTYDLLKDWLKQREDLSAKTP
ncbi:MAG: hypothetical protein NTW19_22290 [Planctomycetota bacterium]|nr:hypothetical protein [Planctomycetota bacterium]